MRYVGIRSRMVRPGSKLNSSMSVEASRKGLAPGGVAEINEASDYTNHSWALYTQID